MNVIKTVSAVQAADFGVRFHKDARYKKLRFGQAFLNEFYPHLSYPELYYEASEQKAKIMIFAYLVDYTKKGTIDELHRD